MRTLSRLAIATALVVTGCGSSNPTPSPAASTAVTPSPAASITPAPTSPPTPEPVDVAAVFQETLGRPATFTATVEGTITAPTGATPVTGTYAQGGRDSRMLLTVGSGDASRRAEITVVLAQRSVVSRGLQVRSPIVPGTVTIAGYIDGLTAFEDQGVVDSPFGPANHIVGTGTVGSLDFLPNLSSEAAGAPATLDFYARPDGTPLGMVAAATWTGAKGAASAELVFTVDPDGADTITAPDQVYTIYQSKRYRFSMAHPFGWEADPAPDSRTFDRLIGTDSETVQLFRAKLDGGTLNEWTSIYLREAREDLKNPKTDSNVTAKLGGSRARRVTLHGTYDGDRVSTGMVVAVRSGYYYVVTMDVFDVDIERMNEIFDPILNSVRYG